jgi:fructose-specific phosphotransferase system IIB component
MSENTQPMRLVGATSCIMGMAHSYMAAKALMDAAAKMGIDLHLEIHGAMGVENQLTPDQIAGASAVVLATDVAVKSVDRFAGMPTLKVRPAEAIRGAESVLERAMALVGSGASNG